MKRVALGELEQASRNGRPTLVYAKRREQPPSAFSRFPPFPQRVASSGPAAENSPVRKRRIGVREEPSRFPSDPDIFPPKLSRSLVNTPLRVNGPFPLGPREESVTNADHSRSEASPTQVDQSGAACYKT